jgi:hypothetical protein
MNEQEAREALIERIVWGQAPAVADGRIALLDAYRDAVREIPDLRYQSVFRMYCEAEDRIAALEAALRKVETAHFGQWCSLCLGGDAPALHRDDCPVGRVLLTPDAPRETLFQPIGADGTPLAMEHLSDLVNPPSGWNADPAPDAPRTCPVGVAECPDHTDAPRTCTVEVGGLNGWRVRIACEKPLPCPDHDAPQDDERVADGKEE